MMNEEVPDCLGLIKNIILNGNSWTGEAKTIVEKCFNTAIKSLKTIQRIDDVLNVEGMTEVDALDEIIEAVSEFKYDCGVDE